MIGLLRSGVLALALAGVAVPAHAGQLCGWLIETIQDDDLHQFELWLQSEGDADVVYKMRGEGIVSESSRSYSPGSGTYSLHARKAVKVWGFGTTLNAPADIDIVAEIRTPPKSVFSDEETPLLAKFSFQRHVPEGETAPPKPFGSRQCVTLAAGGSAAP
jgi:hypothetical protein